MNLALGNGKYFNLKGKMLVFAKRNPIIFKI